MMPSRNMPKQLGSSYNRYNMLGCLMTMIVEVMHTLELTKKGWQNGRELGIWHLVCERLQATRTSFIALHVEADDFYRNNPTKSKAFHACSLYGLGEQMEQELFDLYDKLNDWLRSSFTGFISDK